MEAKEQKSFRELIEEANRLLKSNGFDIFGRNKRESNYFQITFEQRMQTGAYSRSSERSRR